MTEVVYFLSDGGELIKVGRTKGLDFRIATLQREAGKPLNLIGTVDGGSRLEAQIHRQLKEHRITGEWFRDCAEVRTAVGEYLDGSAEEEGKLPDIRSLQPFTFTFEFDPLRLEKAEASLALARAERMQAERELEMVLERLSKLQENQATQKAD